MSSIDVDYSRIVLQSVIDDVRQHIQGVKLRDAWVYKVGKDHWEFHYTDSAGASLQPNGSKVSGQPSFYWQGSADNAFDARAKGWGAYLENLGVEGYTRL